MKSFTYIALFLTLGSLMSCTEVITLDLNDGEPTLVIEATLNGQDSTLTVLLTESGSFIDPGDYPSVSNASVTLKESTGEKLNVPEEEPGLYTLGTLKIEAGESYTLSVISNGEEYLAHVKVPSPLQIDSVSFESSGNPRFGEGFYPTIHYQASTEEVPWVRVKITTDDSLFPVSFIPLENVVSLTSVTLLQATYLSGEKLVMEVQPITEEVFRYFEEISELKGEGFGPGAASTAPSNPRSQWTGNALGYFNAHIPSRIEAIVP